MKKSIVFAGRKHRQRGFSVLEVLVATVMISLLVASGLYYANIGDKADAVDVAASKATIVVRFPEALMTVYALKQTLEDATAADLVSTGSVRSNSPVTWAVADGDDAPEASTLSINMTFDDSETASAMEDYLNGVTGTTLVSSAKVDTNNDAILKVTYEL